MVVLGLQAGRLMVGAGIPIVFVIASDRTRGVPVYTTFELSKKSVNDPGTPDVAIGPVGVKLLQLSSVAA